MSPWAHDLSALLLIVAGLVVLLAFVDVDQSVGWALIVSAGIPVAIGRAARARGRRKPKK